MQRRLGRAFFVTRVPPREGNGEKEIVCLVQMVAAQRLGEGILRNLELWRGGSQEAVHRTGHVLPCRAPV